MISSEETGDHSRTFNHQSTPLLQSSSRPSHYGSNDSTETLGKSRMSTVSEEETNLEEEQEREGLLVKSTERQPGAIEPQPTLDARVSFPLRRMLHVLTGGWCDEVSLRLQNSGSVARDHLALERTFLAYMRTSLAIASAGVALVQLFNASGKTGTGEVQKSARPLGASLIAMGLLVLGTGLTRYFVVQSSLVKGMFPVTRLGPMFIAVTLTSLITVVFWLLLAGH